MKYEKSFPSEEKAHLREELGFKGLSLEDRQKLVSVFVWLLKEDKIQNPSSYVIRKTQKL